MLFRHFLLPPIRQLSTKNIKNILDPNRNKRYAFLRRVPMRNKLEIEEKLKFEFNSKFLFTSNYVEDCDIFLEMGCDDFNNLNLWHKSIQYKEHELEQISLMNGYFIKTNVFIRLDTSFELKCPTIDTTYVKVVPRFPGFYNIRTKDPDRIDEILHNFNNGKYFTDAESAFLLVPHIYLRQSFHTEKMYVFGNNLNERLEAVEKNNWKLVEIATNELPIILPPTLDSFRRCLDYFDDVKNIYCNPITMSSVFKRYQNNFHVIKPPGANIQLSRPANVNEGNNPRTSSSQTTLMDFSSSTTSHFKTTMNKLFRTSTKRKGNVFKKPFVITQIPQQCLHDGFIQSSGILDSNPECRLLNMPNFKFLYSNEIRLIFPSQRISQLVSFLDISIEQIKLFENRRENIIIYAKSYEQFENLCLQLNAIGYSTFK